MFADIILLNSPVSVAKTRLGSEVALENEGLKISLLNIRLGGIHDRK